MPRRAFDPLQHRRINAFAQIQETGASHVTSVTTPLHAASRHRTRTHRAIPILTRPTFVSERLAVVHGMRQGDAGKCSPEGRAPHELTRQERKRILFDYCLGLLLAEEATKVEAWITCNQQAPSVCSHDREEFWLSLSNNMLMTLSS